MSYIVRNVKDIAKDVQSGIHVPMDNWTKNAVNDVIEKEISIGDTVQVIKTGETGVVTKKIKYDRKHQNCYSCYGYTAIQVDMGNRKRNYAGRSLRIIKKVSKEQ